MVGEERRGNRNHCCRSLMIQQRLLHRPIRLLCTLLLLSKLCFFSHNKNNKSQAPLERSNYDHGFPFLVASWTTESMISSHRRRFSTNANHPAAFSLNSRGQEFQERIVSSPFRLFSSTIDSCVNGSQSISTTTRAWFANNTHTFGSSHSTVRIHRLAGVRRVHCISDLHVDNTENMQWLETRCRLLNSTDHESANPATADSSAHPRFDWDETDLIIVAGDISHDMTRIEDSLRLLQQTGAHVVFVPGNHEAWLSKVQKEVYDNNDDEYDSGEKRYSSLTKLEDIERLCQKLGVFTTGDCICVGGDMLGVTESTGKTQDKKALLEELWILPLDSWYDGSLSFVDLHSEDSSSIPHYDMVEDFGKWPWVDFQQCRWPETLFREETPDLLQKIPCGAVDYFLNRNQPVIDAFQNATRRPTTAVSNAANTEEDMENKRVTVLTVTHFLPNPQSLPDWKDLQSKDFDFDVWLNHGAGGTSAKFALVGGSDKIDAQIRSLSLSPKSTANTMDEEKNNGGFFNRIHVFGHSHRPKDFVYEGIRYVHNPLGKPRERQIHMVDPEVNPKLLWEAGRDNLNHSKNETIIRYWEEKGGGLKMLNKRLGEQRENRKLFYRKRKLRKQE